MTTPIIQNFEKILGGGKDNTLLRFSWGNEYLKTGDSISAAKPPEAGGGTGSKILRRVEAAGSRPRRIGPARRRLGRLPRRHCGGRSDLGPLQLFPVPLPRIVTLRFGMDW